MWQTPEQAKAWNEGDVTGSVASPAEVQGYDVATARGSMTPASFAALVDWQVDQAHAASFVNRWNAVYHAIEDSIGSRLLQRLDEPSSYTGLHVVTDEKNLDAGTLNAEIKDEGLSLTPHTVSSFNVVLLSEA